jgi:antirestriction protein
MNEQQPTQQHEEPHAKDHGHEVESGIQPRIYVASLSDYNAGRLHGVWLHADADAEMLAEGVQQMLDTSPESGAEEFAIHDFESFGPLRIDEFEPLEGLSRIGRGIGQHGLAFAHWADLVGTRDSDSLDRFEDAYLGHFASSAEYAESLIEDTGLQTEIDTAIPDFLSAYVQIDFEGFGRDLELSGDITTSAGDGGIYIFDGTV